ncbi:MAG: peptide chain release factor 1 [Chloroflexi bacterium]|nr:peptide chain release factor 1 [Chloroflexota bacterium]
MLDKLTGLAARYDELNRQMAESATDYARVADLARERSEIEPLVATYREFQHVTRALEQAQAMRGEADHDLRALAEAEAVELEPKRAALEKELRAMLLPRDPRDEKDVFVEIRAGTGGEEAALFAADLFRLYTRYAEKRGWKTEVLSQNETGIGGYKEIIFQVKGKGAYSRLKYESGVHRVQRIPVTESQGRIHTSTATVAVLAEVDEVAIDIPDRDIKMEVYRSSGAGGQNVQKNSTAVRLTHLPTGMVVQCQDERSQLQNRLRAMAILRARLFEIEEKKRRTEIEASRRAQVGSGERSEKIRTFNFPQSRVTDHRLGKSLFNMEAVLQGEIDDFIDELVLQEEAEHLQASGLAAGAA